MLQCDSGRTRPYANEDQGHIPVQETAAAAIFSYFHWSTLLAAYYTLG